MVTKITPEQLFQKLQAEENVLLLDVRAEEKYKDFHIEDTNVHSVNIPKTEIFKLTEEREAVVPALPTDQEIVVTCTTGNSASKCATILAEKGLDVIVLDGGINAWKDYLEKE
ncbi:rhodanese-like domain-containing protein [Lysinibacillus antri]|uniref:Rhodanese-like domain-containing protein n=1 Tax=Lysinibacillus antri TaxID=2498145 RepID=A0A3S0RV01_9BACI|nr:rhodanese-like domain-containing protein [Lysinibacillus antri]RUL51297.1 rhodanese-like domain-containing protein [Lysinibacillus antri]